MKNAEIMEILFIWVRHLFPNRNLKTGRVYLQNCVSVCVFKVLGFVPQTDVSMIRPHTFLCRWSSWWWIRSSDSHGGGETTVETAKHCPLGGVGRAKCLQQCLVFGDSLSEELAWSLSSCDCSEMCQDCGAGLESHCTIPICVYNIPAVNHMALNVKELFSYSELICNFPLFHKQVAFWWKWCYHHSSKTSENHMGSWRIWLGGCFQNTPTVKAVVMSVKPLCPLAQQSPC